MNKKSECHRLFVLFTFFGLKAAEVHGNLNQRQRMESVEKFQSGEVDFLLATDLLARGLDIYNVQCVLNLTFPNEENRYVHRVGRTARAGNAGTAITLCDNTEKVACQKVVRKCKGTAKGYSYPKQLKDTILTLINLLDEPLKTILSQEREEFQLKRAETELKKAQNILSYKDEIYNRPKKEWFQSKKQKDEANTKNKEEMKTREFQPPTMDEEFRKHKALKRKLKLVEKIKARKRDLRDQEQRAIQFEKREKKRMKRGKRPNKQQDQPMQPKHKRPKSKMVHGKNTAFGQEL